MADNRHWTPHTQINNRHNFIIYVQLLIIIILFLLPNRVTGYFARRWRSQPINQFNGRLIIINWDRPCWKHNRAQRRENGNSRNQIFDDATRQKRAGIRNQFKPIRLPIETGGSWANSANQIRPNQMFQRTRSSNPAITSPINQDEPCYQGNIEPVTSQSQSKQTKKQR